MNKDIKALHLLYKNLILESNRFNFPEDNNRSNALNGELTSIAITEDDIETADKIASEEDINNDIYSVFFMENRPPYYFSKKNPGPEPDKEETFLGLLTPLVQKYIVIAYNNNKRTGKSLLGNKHLDNEIKNDINMYSDLNKFERQIIHFIKNFVKITEDYDEGFDGDYSDDKPVNPLPTTSQPVLA